MLMKCVTFAVIVVNNISWVFSCQQHGAMSSRERFPGVQHRRRHAPRHPQTEGLTRIPTYPKQGNPPVVGEAADVELVLESLLGISTMAVAVDVNMASVPCALLRDRQHGRIL